ncbi:MerR family transcriptional regulator [Ruania suaedae]|uniref:MerR family transcriptional regulator n=1 Tax=Ruania suaedae TaxID=2897774 RepID=UPI001E4707D5|nr:MerR family transcriptional regulator [Ruania suaedae]UFU01693.1 MerR family transcriptional regulator [Ruania suaedae]
MGDRLSIGEFSRVTHLSIRTLRRYHDQGLLVPAEVDPWSGYRCYSTAQVGPALTIRRLRELDLPLADIRRFTGDGRGTGEDEDGQPAARQVVVTHLRRLEDRLGRTQRAVEALRELLDPEAEREVTIETLPAQRVLAVSVDVPPGSDLSWYDEAMRDLDDAAGTRPVQPPGGRYAHHLFSEGHGSATVYLPSHTRLSDGAPPTVREVHLPERTAAVATHTGPHDDIDLTYGAVGAFAARRDLARQDLVEEIYLVGPRETQEPSRWRTLVAWLLAP